MDAVKRVVEKAGGYVAQGLCSAGIAEAYFREFGVRPEVVSNAPPYADLEPTPVHAPVRVLHHGAALPGRGLEEMVRLADLLDERFTLDFVLVEGPGAPGFREELIAQARHNPRVRFPRTVQMRELVSLGIIRTRIAGSVWSSTTFIDTS